MSLPPERDNAGGRIPAAAFRLALYLYQRGRVMRYEITKQFIGGILNGLTIVEFTTVQFAVGFVCHKPIGGSPYRIVSVRRV